MRARMAIILLVLLTAMLTLAAQGGGDPERGGQLYVENCAVCHGADGQGIPLNAPRQAGMSDWYLLDQLKNFKQGIRGDHPHDLAGMQMGFMSRTLLDDQAMRDVVAYINTL